MKGRKWLALVVCIGVLTVFITPTIVNSYYERIRYIKPSSLNVFEFGFLSHWKQVASVLDLDKNVTDSVRIENLNIDYEKNGKIKSLRYELTWKEKEQLHHATVNYDEGQKKISVKVTKVPEWLQYDELTNANRLFEKLDKVNLKDMTSREDYPFYGLLFGGPTSFGIKNEEVYIIDNNNRIVPYKEKLPVEGYWIRTFGMARTDDTGTDNTGNEVKSYSSVNARNYLFNLQ